MLAANPHPHVSMNSPSSRKRLAGAEFPPAKRAKTASSSSVPRTADSTIASHFEVRRRRAAGWLGVNDGPGTPNAAKSPLGEYSSPRKSTLPRDQSEADIAVEQPNKIGPTAPTPALLARINATNDRQDSRQASDDFRSVIDDLTIQNKKLKTKLRKYARLHSAHLQKEKLFEIKVHEGLPAHKKRELEETLRNFAASIDNSSTEPISGEIKLSATKKSSGLQHASSSSTSDSKVVDSAYASGSHSGNHLSRSNSGVNSGMNSGVAQNSKARDHKIKSYLDDIPETLYPSKSPTLSDKAKSKLVVRRLEQIFTGRGAATHAHNHSQQQQDVSTAAAEHERSKLTAGGMRVWQEGTREAQILPESTLLREDSTDSNESNKSHDSNDGTESQDRAGSPPKSPEQRPTRPLDLDIHRAQVPAENMEYIRHLSAPDLQDEEQPLADGEGGWVYLNLIMSMAQLHTVNVTPEFIRKAVQNYSQRLELSQDGTMIRWLGGTRGSRLSSAGDDPDGQWRSSDSSNSVSKKDSTDDFSIKDNQSGGQSSPRRNDVRGKRSTIPIEDSIDSERFQYKPLFLHRHSSTEDDDSDFGSDSPASTNSMEYDTGINSSSNAIQTLQPRLKGRRHDNGPIIFYHRAKFCTDLGGDPTFSGSNVAYNRFVEQPVGSPAPSPEDADLEDKDTQEQKKADPMALTSSPKSNTRSALDLGDLANSISDCTSQSAGVNPVDMEASGLGGIHPSDNFVVKVQTRHHSSTTSLNQQPRSRKSPHRRLLHRLPISNLSAFHAESQRPPIPRSSSSSAPNFPPVKAEIISAVKSTLPPSSLPPPSYGMAVTSTSESSSSDSDGVQSSLSSASARAARFNPRHMPHHINPSTAFHNFVDPNSKNTSSSSVAKQTPAPNPAPPQIPAVQRRTQPTLTNPPRLHNNPSTSTEETKESSPSPSDEGLGSDDDDDDDGSIDLLWNARLQDPEAVEKKEREMREWEREQEAGEESVSVAATGGGSDDGDEEGSVDSMSIEQGDIED